VGDGMKVVWRVMNHCWRSSRWFGVGMGRAVKAVRMFAFIMSR